MNSLVVVLMSILLSARNSKRTKFFNHYLAFLFIIVARDDNIPELTTLQAAHTTNQSILILPQNQAVHYH